MSAYGAVTVTTTPVKIISTNTRRIAYVIVNNDSTNSVFIGFDASVTVSNGLPIVATGNIAQSSSNKDLWLGDIWGVSAGSIDVRWQEQTRG